MELKLSYFLKSIYLALPVILLSQLPLFCQAKNSDTAQINKLNILCRQLIKQNNLNRAMQLSDSMVFLSENVNYTPGKIEAYHNISYIYFRKNAYGKAIEYERKKICLYQKNSALNEIGMGYKAIGSLYFYLVNLDSSIVNYQKAFSYYKQSKNKKEKAYALAAIGSLYNEKHDYLKAIKNTLAAAKIFKKLEIIPGLKDAYQNLADIYENKGDKQQAESYRIKIRGLSPKNELSIL